MSLQAIFARNACACILLLTSTSYIAAEAVVPGTGTKLDQVGDDFEDAQWDWKHNWPKSSQDLDGVQNGPGGESANGRWYEGIKRGHPDTVKRVETPSGGLPLSKGSLLLRSLHTGVASHPSYSQQQDDLIADVQYRLGSPIPVSRVPNVVTRVFLPPIDEWENRSGCHFAFRCSVDTAVQRTARIRSRSRSEQEIYYPGFFLDFEAKEDSGGNFDTAVWRIRADTSGNDFPAREIDVTGWWTLGMSFTPDGAVHYYASPGIEDLTSEDLITSQVPYGFNCDRFRTFFFNICNGDDGRTWSTEWIVDDPTVYTINRN